MPLTNSEIRNRQIYAHATEKGYEIELSNHSRGGLTTSVALKNANRHGITEIPITKSRFYGTATNVEAYNNQLARNGYLDKEGIRSSVYSANHKTDFVGRPLGFNPATNGLWGFIYSHSSYYARIPKEYLVDEKGHDLVDENDKIIKNKEYEDYVKAWGEPPQDGYNASAPHLYVRDENGKLNVIDTQEYNNKNTTPSGKSYIEVNGVKYHANPY